MARTVPGRDLAGGEEGVRIPDAVRHMAGLPIVAGGAAPTGPTGQWRDVILASNLAWTCDGMGAVLGMAWRQSGLVGLLTSTLRVRVPVAGASHARARIRAWATGNAANDAALALSSATVGPGTLTVGNGPAGRYPAPGSDVIVDAGPDVVVDPDAGPYVDLEVTAAGTWNSLASLHLDLVELGAPANYPTEDTTLPAGVVGDFVAGDTDDCAAGLPLGSDTLFERLAQWPEQWERRKVVMAWSEFDRVGGEMPPRRRRGVLRVPAGGRTRVTIAAYLPAITGTTRITLHRDDGELEQPGGGSLAFLLIPGSASPGWHMATTEVRLDGVDLGCPPTGLTAFASVILRCSGAAPILDGGGVGDARQVRGAASAVHSLVVWAG